MATANLSVSGASQRKTRLIVVMKGANLSILWRIGAIWDHFPSVFDNICEPQGGPRTWGPEALDGPMPVWPWSLVVLVRSA